MAVPKIIPYDVELRSVNPVRSFDRPKAYTNDRKSVEFQFKILDMTSTDLETATAITLVYMRDGSFFANPSTDVKRVGNVFSYLLKENEGNHAGVAQIQLVVTIDDAEFASQLFDFEIINGLETKVAQEVMIYDWTTLTRDARAYIDEFVANEVFRDAQFENAQFDRNVAFVSSQESRALAFGVEQTDRGEAFTTEQTNRNTAFTNDQDARALTFSESESGRTTAETGRVTAESNRVTAESGRVTKESQRVTAESSRVTAESGRVTAESGRVTAENARVTAETNRAAAFTAFNTRLTAEETATANNRISAVKGKTFADVDARFEDVEADSTLMGTNVATNGDFSNGTSGWSSQGSTLSASDNTLQCVGDGTLISYPTISQNKTLIQNNRYYLKAMVRVTNSVCNFIRMGLKTYSSEAITVVNSPVQNTWYAISSVITASDTSTGFKLYHAYTSTAGTLGMVMEVRYFVAIDLTAAFGAGNEPTAEQMDGIMDKFTNSWFNGTANLFRANATLNKLMAVDARTEFDAKNDVINGDFSNGVTGWNFNQSTASILNNECTVTGDGSITSFGIYQNTNGTFNTGDIIYYRERFKATGSQPTSFQLRARSSQGAPSAVIKTISSPTLGTWYDVSERYTMLSTNTGTIQATSTINYADAASQALGSVVFKSIVAINLTKAFGAGKEPTLAEMDRLMARFPNSWFDGVKPVQTIETLYQEKANKVQEAWITPTLVNSWVNYDAVTYPLGYRKNQFGNVELRGRLMSGVVGQAMFTLPDGYRPTQTIAYPVDNNGVFGRVLIYTTGAVSLTTGTNTTVFLSNIAFPTT